MYFDDKIILFDQDVNDREQALTTLADDLFDKGKVTDTFKPAILEREKNYPTGIAMPSGEGIAIPHTDTDKVIKSQIAFMRLKKPVKFEQMDGSGPIDVKLIFMLAFTKSSHELQLLQKFMTLFQNRKQMNKLNTAKTKAEFLDIMREAGIHCD